MEILCHSCQKIHSSLSENCKGKLFNTTTIKKEKRKIGFSLQGKSNDKFDLRVSLNLL